jgi:hypothetical protein
LRRRGRVYLPKAFDHHLGILAWNSAGDSHSGNVGEVRGLFLLDYGLKLIAVGRWL